MRCLIALLGALAAVPLAARAASCSFSTAGVSFSTYDPMSTAATRGATTIQYACSSSTYALITISAGASGTVGARAMTRGPDRLAYNLYKDAAATIVWGDTLGSGLITALGTGGTLWVYGSIPPRQDVAAGSYADTLTITYLFL